MLVLARYVMSASFHLSFLRIVIIATSPSHAPILFVLTEPPGDLGIGESSNTYSTGLCCYIGLVASFSRTITSFTASAVAYEAPRRVTHDRSYCAATLVKSKTTPSSQAVFLLAALKSRSIVL